MNEMDLKKYRGYYNGIMLAAILCVIIPFAAEFLQLRSLLSSKDIAMIFVLYYTYKVSRMSKFTKQKPIFLLVIIWLSVTILSTVYMINQLMQDATYLENGILTFVDVLISLSVLVLVTLISIRCYQNVKILKTIEPVESIEPIEKITEQR